MSYQNISYVVSETDAATIRNSINTVNQLMPFLVTLTSEERQRLLKHGDANTEFVSDCIFCTINFAQIFPSTFDIPEYQRDNNLYNLLGEFRLLLQSTLEKIIHTEMAVGNELMRASNRVYDIVQREKETTPGIQALAEKLSKRYKKQGNRRPGVAENDASS